MHINQLLKASSGSIVSVHRLRRIEVSDGAIHAIINSYADDEQEAVLWQDSYDLPADAISAAPFTATFNWLVSDAGPFAGGALIEDPTTLEAARARAWVRIKYQRGAVEQAGCETSYGGFDTTVSSLTKLNGAIAAASIVPDFAIDWTMADNSVATLDAAALQAVGLAVFAFVDAVHQRSRVLRGFIDECEDIEALDGLDWDTDIAGATT